MTTGSAQNINSATGNLDFEIGGTDMYLDLCESAVIADIKVTVAADKNIVLENNFFPSMFSQMVLRINGNSFQTVDYPDIIDSIMKHVTLPKDYAETEGCITGWFPDTHSGGVVNKLSDEATTAQIVARLNLEKVNEGFHIEGSTLRLHTKINLRSNTLLNYSLVFLIMKHIVHRSSGLYE